MYTVGVYFISFDGIDGLKTMGTKGDRIRDCMKKTGINQQQLAKRLDVYPSAVAKWLANENTPQDEYILKMAEIFEVEPTWLDWGATVVDETTDELARKIAELNPKDQKLIKTVLDAMATDENGDKNDSENTKCQ